jgi:hypothetical protein
VDMIPTKARVNNCFVFIQGLLYLIFSILFMGKVWSK